MAFNRLGFDNDRQVREALHVTFAGLATAVNFCLFLCKMLSISAISPTRGVFLERWCR
jgi:hypothetical protein